MERLKAEEPSNITVPMTINKQFAQDGAALKDCLDQLVEILAQLLEDAPAATALDDPEAAITDLRPEDDRVIHVVGNGWP